MRWLLISLAMAISFQLPLTVSAQVPAPDSQVELVPYDETISGSESFYNSWDGIDWLLETEGNLILSPQDRQDIEDGKVDVRVTDYLLNLVLPEEEGGQGLERVKIKRITKNYDTDGIGKYDRESAEAVEEDDRAISTHNRGQAVDISEVGEITCKLVEKSHATGKKTRWQSPRAIKIAWQSNDGIARNPTPKGPSVVEASSYLTSDALIQMMIETGEFDEYVTVFRGLDLPSVLSYVGANIALKQLGVRDIKADPLSDSLINTLGATLLEKYYPALPDGLIAAPNDEDARIAVARAQLEELLGLPNGTLRGNGWEEILVSAGKRRIENAVGLPTLYLEKYSLEDLNKIEKSKGSMSYLKRSDASFNVPAGSLDLIKKNDSKGLALAGVNVLAAAFKMNSDQKKALEQAVRAGQNPTFDTDSLVFPNSIPVETIRYLFSSNPEEERRAQESLRKIGQDLLSAVLKSKSALPFEGITEEIVNVLTGSKSITLEELKRQIGNGKLASSAGLESKETANLNKGKSSSVIEKKIAEYLNGEFELASATELTAGDIHKLISGESSDVINKVASYQSDKAMNWSPGTGKAVIEGKKTLEEAMEEVFANSIGEMIGLDRNSGFNLSGNLQENYGEALLKKRLGLSTQGKSAATDISQADLYKAFGISSSRSLTQLRNNPEFWSDQSTKDSLALSDARLGVDPGTSERFLKGELDVAGLEKKVSSENIENIALDSVISYFDLENAHHLKGDQIKDIINTIKNWDTVPLENREKTLALGVRLVTQWVDNLAGFQDDFFYSYITEPDSEVATKKLLDQGIRKLAASFGVNIEDFDREKWNEITNNIKDVFNSGGDANQLIETIMEATNIPPKYRDDAAAIINGDLDTVMRGWTATLWQDFANDFLPENAQLTYEEIRTTFKLDIDGLVNQKANELLADAGVTNPSPTQLASATYQARRLMMQDANDNVRYKLSDAMLEKALGEEVPANFTKTMYTGSSQQRAELLTDFVLVRIESALMDVEPSYRPGLLQRVLKGEVTAREADQIVMSIIERSGVKIGEFDSGFIADFYSFLKGAKQADFYTNGRYESMWRYLDNWLETKLGLGNLPNGLAKSVYYASQNGWDLNTSIEVNGQTVVPSLSQLGEAFLVNKLSEWGDKELGLPSGTIYQVYKAVRAIETASRALAAARAANDAAAISQASTNLSQAQAELTMIVITIALNACDTCQQFFASVDKALQAPPGFTNALVAGAIAMALGLGPAGLIIAAAIYLFGVYDVDYLCPAPPPDWYAIASYDTADDQLNYKWGDYYKSVTDKVKDNPAPGENPFDWDEGVPFVDGNDPDLWKAWSRYFTGKLLDESVRFGEERERPHKPKQIITLRRANAEFFYPRLTDAFGQVERDNPDVGFGYSQTTTKTTDWVHVAFGGYF